MNFLFLVLGNLLNIPLIAFVLGVMIALIRPGCFRLLPFLNKALVVYILFCIGLKGGGPLADQYASAAMLFFMTTSALVVWGFVSPLLSYGLLKKFTRVDSTTAAAIAACLGSVSVMTFIAAVAFLDQQQVPYQNFIIASLAIMEVPAIISGLCIAKKFDENKVLESSKLSKIIIEAVLNKAVIALFFGLLVGGVLFSFELGSVSTTILLSFKPVLCLFLFDMGLSVGSQKEHFRSFSRSLHFFALYMPLIGGGIGLLLSYLFGLDVGSGTLVAVITASASYIAVPAAMRIALPAAKEGIYLPLSLGIVFPFNVVIGIPLYYYLSLYVLG